MPELSIIIPTLREARTLPQLIARLAGQRGVELEIICSDGGSDDGSDEIVRREAGTVPFPVTFLAGTPGRGGQLNRGAEMSRGEFLLFLHADSSFPDPLALRRSLDHLRSVSMSGIGNRAGKFSLRFDRSGTDHPFGYYYHESKARLVRRECTHGDQGLLLHRDLFASTGPFDETLYMLAETRLADTLTERGLLTLLPSEIITSARRFEAEGMAERQTLNAIIMNFASQGWSPFFDVLPSLYPRQDQAGPLPLRQALQRVARLVASRPVREQVSLWLQTGAYVRANSWQVAFAADCWRNLRRGLPPGEGTTTLLAFHDRHVNPLTDNAAGRIVATLLVRFWFFAVACR